ncbi:MAG: hypothetical protein AB7O04_06340 [Hyphomonadaceae bacterium]
MKRSFAFAGAAALMFACAAPFALAQQSTPTNPPEVQQPQTQTPQTQTTPQTTPPNTTPPNTTATDPNPVDRTSPPDQIAGQTSQAAQSTATAAPQGCRTRKQAGEPCACLSDPSRIGQAQSHPDGHNVCVRPD